MVQFREDNDCSLKEGTDYWKLERPESLATDNIRRQLRAFGYTWPASTDAKGLASLLVRARLGFLCYHKCANGELRTFIANRAVSAPPMRASRSELIRSLEVLDDDLSFPRFLELPAELRQEVYNINLKSNVENWAGRTGIERPEQAPVTKVNRQLRTESLPTFYKTFPFYLQFEPQETEELIIDQIRYDEDWGDSSRERYAFSHLIMGSETAALLKKTPTASLKLVQWFEFDSEVIAPGTAEDLGRLLLRIDLRPSTDSTSRVTNSRYWTKTQPVLSDDIRERIMSSIRQIVAGMMARPVNERFQERDIDAMRREFAIPRDTISEDDWEEIMASNGSD